MSIDPNRCTCKPAKLTITTFARGLVVCNITSELKIRIIEYICQKETSNKSIQSNIHDMYALILYEISYYSIF